MVVCEEIRLEVVAIKPQLEDLYVALSIKEKKDEAVVLEEQTLKAGFWDDKENSQQVIQKTAMLKSAITNYEKLFSQYEDLIALIDMVIEADDEDSLEEVKAEHNSFSKKLAQMKLETLLAGEYDAKNAILALHSGAGGTEAQDWVAMLSRMYQQWANKKGFKVTILDYLAGDEAGTKSITLLFEGINAYGFLKSEMGVHRLVRISPFDSSGRRHTSFASLEVMPEIDDTVEVDIRPEDLDVSAYRAGGAGGQNVNKVSSAVRIVHIPTGIVCACQTERSQLQNKANAMKMLRSKLIQIKEREHLDKISDIKGDQKDIAWGSQIRSYTFMPYTLVKDHRTSCENGNVQAVMDGELDGFINAYLTAKSRGEI